MPRYRFDFKDHTGAVFATHEIVYEGDNAAIKAGHSINGFPTIGACFEVWRDSRLIHSHRNLPPSPDNRPFDALWVLNAVPLQAH